MFYFIEKEKGIWVVKMHGSLAVSGNSLNVITERQLSSEKRRNAGVVSLVKCKIFSHTFCQNSFLKSYKSFHKTKNRQLKNAMFSEKYAKKEIERSLHHSFQKANGRLERVKNMIE